MNLKHEQEARRLGTRGPSDRSPTPAPWHVEGFLLPATLFLSHLQTQMHISQGFQQPPLVVTPAWTGSGQAPLRALCRRVLPSALFERWNKEMSEFEIRLAGRELMLFTALELGKQGCRLKAELTSCFPT